jgi:uncharacterized protein (DUF2267 family)
MSTGLQVLDRTVQESNLWLSDLEARLLVTRHQAYAALRATLHVLRDRLPPATAVNFAAQLPMLLRGLYFEGWSLAPRERRPRTELAFLEDVADRLTAGFPVTTEMAVRETFQTIRAHMDLGEVDKIIDHLPRPVRELWFEDVV